VEVERDWIESGVGVGGSEVEVEWMWSEKFWMMYATFWPS